MSLSISRTKGNNKHALVSLKCFATNTVKKITIELSPSCLNGVKKDKKIFYNKALMQRYDNGMYL
jgi:hypothetical protein